MVREKTACTARPCLSYSKILTELEQRLRASITVQDATLQKLYAPLYHKGNDQRHPSAGHVCSIPLPGLAEAYLDWEAADFFTHLRQSLWGLPGRILEFLNPESCDAGENLSIQQLFQAINGSDLPQSSKLILTDLALNGEQYVDLPSRRLDACGKGVLTFLGVHLAPLGATPTAVTALVTQDEITDRLLSMFGLLDLECLHHLT
ncbi:MAG: hypothetical protein V8T29_01365 [Oscillospiraceae bacterium]